MTPDILLPPAPSLLPPAPSRPMPPADPGSRDPGRAQPTVERVPMARPRQVPPPPLASDLAEECDRIIPTFALRKEQIQLWRKIIRIAPEYARQVPLARSTDTSDDDQLLTVTEAAVMCNDFVRRIGSLDYIIDVAASKRDRASDDVVSTVIRLVDTIFTSFGDDYRAGGGGDSWLRAQVRGFFEDGQLYEVKLLAPARPDVPLSIDLVDPLSMYPVFGRVNGKRCMVRCYQRVSMLVQDIRDQWGDVPLLAGREGLTPVSITNYFDGYYMAAFVDGVFVKPPFLHNYRCAPVTATFWNGFGERGREGAGASAPSIQEREANRGRSPIADHIGTIDQLRRVKSAMMQALNKAADEAFKVKTDRERDDAPEVQNVPGGRTVLIGDEDTEPLNPQGPRELPYVQAIQAGLNNAMQADQLVLTAQQQATGPAELAQQEVVQQRYSGAIEAVEAHYTALANDTLLMLHAWRQSLRPVTVFDTERGKRIRDWVDLDALPDPSQIDVRVRFEIMTDMKRIQIANGVAGAYGAGLLPGRYVREKMLRLPNADLMEEQVLEEQIMKLPQVMQALAEQYVMLAYKRQAKMFAGRGDDDLAAFVQGQYLDMGLQQAQRLMGGGQRRAAGESQSRAAGGGPGGGGGPGQAMQGMTQGGSPMGGPSGFPGQPGLMGPAGPAGLMGPAGPAGTPNPLDMLRAGQIPTGFDAGQTGVPNSVVSPEVATGGVSGLMQRLLGGLRPGG